jgi:hypothetical protein
VTEQERIDRETLLRRAAVAAGAVYVTPVLTSAAGAGGDECLTFTCGKKKSRWVKHRRKCQSSGARCDCPTPGTQCGVSRCSCPFHGPICGYVQACKVAYRGANCACFSNGRGHGENPGGCIDLLDGLCDTFEAIGTCPGGNDSECPPGHVCFTSCCDAMFGYPPLCGPCCGSQSEPTPAARATGGPMVAWM